jgi:hypothetical protein
MSSIPALVVQPGNAWRSRRSVRVESCDRHQASAASRSVAIALASCPKRFSASPGYA